MADEVTAMLAYWDAEQRCRFANRAYERWFGVTPESLIGKHISELLGPIYELNKPYIEAALRGEPQEFEREIPDPRGGASRHSLANYIPDVVDGVVRGFYVLVSDISEIKRAQLALRESEARFSGIISIAADAIISVDERHRITIFNAAAERTFGTTRDEVIGRDISVLLPSGWPDAEASRDAAVSLVGLRKNGERFPAEATISKLQLDHATLFTIALRDITERKRTEMEQTVLAETGTLLASSLNYKKTLAMISELITRHVADMCIIDMFDDDAKLERLTVTHADPAKAELADRLAQLPLDPQHTLGAPVRETRQPHVFADITPALIDAFAQNEEHGRLLRELGARCALVVPLLAPDAVVGALILVASRPHRYDDRDIALATEIARRAALAIQNARLYEAEQRAKHARDEVLGIVAHDVRSPLNSIALCAEVLKHKLAAIADGSGQEQVATILRSVERANALIQDLLDVSRIEAGVLALARDVIAPELIVEELSRALGHVAAAAAIELHVVVDAALPRIHADRHRLLQVFENLVGNALKFTPRGGSITLAASARERDVLFSVRDTGSGIPAEDVPHVFDRFWQSNRTTRTGAGLGLPICKGIVEQHGGQLWVESTLGSGTTFFFTLPRATIHAAARPPVAQPQDPPSTTV